MQKNFAPHTVVVMFKFQKSRIPTNVATAGSQKKIPGSASNHGGGGFLFKLPSGKTNPREKYIEINPCSSQLWKRDLVPTQRPFGTA